jgi:hypothetical protein
VSLLLNPIFTFTFQHISIGDGQKNVDGGFFLSLLSAMITFGIIYLGGLFCLWIINYLMVRSGNFGEFIKIYSLQFNTFKIVSFIISFITILIILFLYLFQKRSGPILKAVIFINFVFYSVAEFKNVVKVLNKK